MIKFQKHLTSKEFNKFFSQEHSHQDGRRYLEYYFIPGKLIYDSITTIHTYSTPGDTSKGSLLTYIFLKTYFFDFFCIYKDIFEKVISVDGYLGITLSYESLELISIRISYNKEVENIIIKKFHFFEPYLDKKYCFLEISFQEDSSPKNLGIYSKSSTGDFDASIMKKLSIEQEDIFLFIYGDIFNIDNSLSVVHFSYRIKSLKLFESKNIISLPESSEDIYKSLQLILKDKNIYVNAVDIIEESFKLRCTNVFISEEI